MTAFNGYPISFVLAVLLHVMVVVALFLFQRSNPEAIQIAQPPAVRAQLVGMNPQARNQQVQEQRESERAREQRAEQQRREEEQRQAAARQEQQRQEQQRQEQQRQEQQRAEQERQAELQRIAQLQARQEQQQQQDQQRRQEQERAAAEQRQREERERQAQEQQRQQEVAAQQERERQQQAQQQAAAQAQAAAAAQEGEAVMSYTTLIHDLVQQQWSRPPSARNGMMAVLRIRLVPTGEVIDVEVVQSSGDGPFDRAAVTAVNRVGTIRELQGMDPQLFNRNFRTLLLTFRPEDLLN